MDKPLTPYSTWVRETGYPRYSYADGQLTAHDKFYVDSTDFLSSQLQTLSSLKFGALWLSSAEAAPDVSGKKVHISVSYTPASGSGSGRSESGVPEYTLEDGGQEIPISKRRQNGTPWFTKYKTNWDHHMVGTDADVPASWATSTDPATTTEGYRWVREMDSIRSDEVPVKSKQKNADSVIVPAPVVVETRKYDSYTEAATNPATPGTIETPDRVFGYSGQWLIVSVSVRMEGRRWARTVRYQLAEQWDSDLYSSS